MDITALLPPATADDPTALTAAAHAVLDPSGLGIIDRVPLIPESVRRRHRVFIPADHRFKAAARFLQALWREDRGLGIGIRVDSRELHRPRRLGSRISTAAGALGSNFLYPDIVPVVTRALAYREPGAACDVDRLKTNLLSSQPLAFNLFGPLTRDLAFATRFVAELLPGTLTEVTDILFEHSPGRGDPRFTADRTAYDVVLRGRDATGGRALLCVEIKYSEGGHEPAPPPNPRHAEIARTTPGLFVDPDNPTLTGPACQQLCRQHCLASAMLAAGLADTATLAFIAPTHNQLAHAAAAKYTCHHRPAGRPDPLRAHNAGARVRGPGDSRPPGPRPCTASPLHRLVARRRRTRSSGSAGARPHSAPRRGIDGPHHDRHTDSPEAAGPASPAARDPLLRRAGGPGRLTRPHDRGRLPRARRRPHPASSPAQQSPAPRFLRWPSRHLSSPQRHGPLRLGRAFNPDRMQFRHAGTKP